MHLVPYPKSVGFLHFYQFFERSSAFAIGILLPLYLLNYLNIVETEDHAVAYTHIFYAVSFYMAILGGILSDKYLGIYKTVVIFSFVNMVGGILLFLTAFDFATPFIAPLIIGALFLVAFGSGASRPSFQCLGGDQFKMPEQEGERTNFFNHLYLVMNIGIIVAFAVPPILREDVHCFGHDSCYPLAFGVQAVFISLALVSFVAGTFSYIYQPQVESNISKYFSCIWHSIREKYILKNSEKRKHLLDYAEGAFETDRIIETKVLINVLLLHIPLPLYWALYFQQVTRWLFQATRMDGEVFGMQIKPDQFQILNPLLTVICVPITTQILYPVFAKFGMLTTTLQKITTGLFLATIAFIMCGLLEVEVEHRVEENLPGINILWQFPQFLVMSFSEIMLFSPIMDFAYSEAPVEVKSFLQGIQLVTLGLGHTVVAILANISLFDNQSLEFFMYAGLNFLNSLVFMIIAIKYKSYKDYRAKENSEEKA